MANDGTAVTWGDGAAVVFTTQTNALYNNESIHLPWFSMAPYIGTNGPGQSYETGVSSETSISYFPTEQFGIASATTLMSIQAADDFMLIYPVPFFSMLFRPY